MTERVALRARELRQVERVTLTVTFLRGEGIDGDPVREVVAYFTDTGAFIVEVDPGAIRQAQGT